MAFVPEFCSDFPLGYQTIAAMDGNDALVASCLRVGHDEETGEHIDGAIPSGLVRVGTAFQRSVSWAHGCLGFLATERVGVTTPDVLASTSFDDATNPHFVFVSTETDTTGEFAVDAYSLMCASTSEAKSLTNPMVAFWGSRPTDGVRLGFDGVAGAFLPDLNSVPDGETYSRLRGVELSDGVIAKLTGLAGSGADRVVKVENDGTLAATLITSALTDGSFAADADLDALDERVDALEAAPALPPRNGDFEEYSSPDFAHWAVTAGTISTGTDSDAGRYMELGTSAVVESASFIATVPMLLTWRSQANATGATLAVRVRWLDRTSTFISESSAAAAHAATNTWETFTVALTPPAGTRYAFIRLTHEANTPRIGWVACLPAVVASTSSPGIIAAADQSFPTGRRSVRVTGTNTTLATQSTNELRVENTSTGDAVLKLITNGTARAQARADNGGTLTLEASGHQFNNVGSGYVYLWQVNGTTVMRANASGIYLGGGTDPTMPLMVGGNGQLSGNFTPATNGGGSIGTTSLRWGDVWCTDGAFNGSDGRSKKDVKQAPLGLDFVRQLKPVSWKWKQVHAATRLVEVYANEKERAEATEKGLPTQREEHEYREGKRQHHGFIAQDVGELLRRIGADFAGYAHDEATDTYSLRYTEFIAPLTRAVQELAQKLDDALARIAELEAARKR